MKKQKRLFTGSLTLYYPCKFRNIYPNGKLNLAWRKMDLH